VKNKKNHLLAKLLSAPYLIDAATFSLYINFMLIEYYNKFIELEGQLGKILFCTAACKIYFSFMCYDYNYEIKCSIKITLNKNKM